MIRIIDGKRYNTDTANFVICWNNGLSALDHNSIDESLYQTSKGSWFIWGEGGANSKYSEVLEGNSIYCAGNRIVPLTPDAAQSWLEEHGMTDELEEYFSGSIEDA